eukprot:scaffold2805_cov202-Prasinococcus_capsulatus_cf.AAC.8
MASSSLSASSASAGRCGGSGVAALRPLRTRGARSAKISRETARPPASVLSCPLPQRRRPRDSDDAYSPGRGAAAAADQHLPLAESDMEKLRRSRFTPFATVFRPRRCPPAAAPEARVDVKYSHPRDAATAEAFIAEPLVVHYRSYTGCQELHHVSSGTTALHSRNSSSSHSSSIGRSSSSRRSSSRRRKVLLGSTISSITVAHSIWTRPVRAADASDWTSPGLAKPTSNARCGGRARAARCRALSSRGRRLTRRPGAGAGTSSCRRGRCTRRSPRGVASVLRQGTQSATTTCCGEATGTLCTPPRTRTWATMTPTASPTAGLARCCCRTAVAHARGGWRGRRAGGAVRGHASGGEAARAGAARGGLRGSELGAAAARLRPAATDRRARQRAAALRGGAAARQRRAVTPRRGEALGRGTLRHWLPAHAPAAPAPALARAALGRRASRRRSWRAVLCSSTSACDERRGGRHPCEHAHELVRGHGHPPSQRPAEHARRTRGRVSPVYIPGSAPPRTANGSIPGRPAHGFAPADRYWPRPYLC